VEPLNSSNTAFAQTSWNNNTKDDPEKEKQSGLRAPYMPGCWVGTKPSYIRLLSKALSQIPTTADAGVSQQSPGMFTRIKPGMDPTGRLESHKATCRSACPAESEAAF
jgi:hypothetical protein